MKKRFVFLCLILLVGFILFTGCKDSSKELPDDPIVFNSGELDVDNEDTGYVTVEHNDKVYIMYGGIKGRGLFGNISYAYGDCLGYVEGDKAQRIYALAGESTDEWLIEYYTAGIMENPIVLREITAKDNKDIPSSVESFEYDYWK